MNDYIVRANSHGLLVFAGSLAGTCNEASTRHICTPTAAAALGRVIIAAALYTENMKQDESVSLRIHGGGTIGEIVATADSTGNVRGYAQHPDADIQPLASGKLDVGGLVGVEGTIRLTRYSDNAKQSFTGAAELDNGEIGDDFANYLLNSEQISSAVGLGVWINPDNSITTAGGFVVMALPECDEATIIALEENIASMRGVTDVLLAGNNAPEALVDCVLKGIDYKITERSMVRFKCNCNYDRILFVLNSLTDADLRHIAEDKRSEMICHFCNEKYYVSRAEVLEMLARRAVLN